MKHKVLLGTAFDAHAGEYEAEVQSSLPKMLSEGDYFSRYKVERVRQSQKANSPQTILDFGCGIGLALELFSQYFPGTSLWGYDVSQLSIVHARDRVPSAELTSNLEDLREAFFDVIFIANVFHHIPRVERLSVLQMCRDILKPEGRIYVFEHNPYNPITRSIFERCVFDQDAEMVSLRSMLALSRRAGLLPIEKGYTLFFPRQMSALRFLEPFLCWLPIGAQYCVEFSK